MTENSKDRIEILRNRWIKKLLGNYFVIKTWLALTFFVLAFGFFAFVLRTAGDLGRILLVVYGIIMIFLCLVLMMEYFIKTVTLQKDKDVKIFSAILSVNTFFGLVLSLLYINIILAVTIRSLALMTYYGTFFCKVRLSLVSFYYNNQIYSQINSVIFWIVIFNIIIFLFGGLFERLLSKK